jgi:2-pyrone-4,6-dicarboxylate lactonase
VDFDTDKAGQVGRPPDAHPRRPRRFTVPRGAVDTHAHVVGTDLIAGRSYTPPPASAKQYLRMLDATGMTYGVLVQISVHGTDNRLLLDTLAAHPDRLRGIAVVAPDVRDTDLGALAAAGVVGLRLNTLAGGGAGLQHLNRYARICQELGWHLQLLTDVQHLFQQRTTLARATVPMVIDHMGDVDIERGRTASDWRFLLDLVADGAWVKLSGAFRLSRVPGYTDTIAFARDLLDVAPQRCVWGSDWPHVGFWGAMPNVGALLDLLVDWAPEPATRDAILTTNAHRLYGFPAPPSTRRG